uniref:Uncharacterized protein n=1 Tax=Trypanosoma vivax (strain Y486) TaxID=1055687 RepID=G0TY86_TRYVY|nr:conserved hypothetical protein [Trypanosoma vivax Y486]
MAPLSTHVHPSLQRYLPGQFPKPQRRQCTGQTNRKAHDAMQEAVIRGEVVPNLTTRDRVNHSTLPSITIMRATSNETAQSARTKRSDSTAYAEQFCQMIEQQEKGRSRDTRKLQVVEDTMVKTLIKTNNRGKWHGMSQENYFIGNEKIGGAGQLEYDDPKQKFNNNYNISAWRNYQFHQDEKWHNSFQKEEQKKDGDNKQTEVTSHRSSNLFSQEHIRNQEQATGKKDEKRDERQLETLETTKISKMQKGVVNYKQQIEKELYQVPPPKLRLELNDYHSTFGLTQQKPEEPMYISEQDRLTIHRRKQLNTPIQKKIKNTRKKLIQ